MDVKESILINCTKRRRKSYASGQGWILASRECGGRREDRRPSKSTSFVSAFVFDRRTVISYPQKNGGVCNVKAGWIGNMEIVIYSPGRGVSEGAGCSSDTDISLVQGVAAEDALVIYVLNYARFKIKLLLGMMFFKKICSSPLVNFKINFIYESRLDKKCSLKLYFC